MAKPSFKPYALVVDDDPVILTQVSDTLGNAGFRTFEAMNVVQAQHFLTGHAPAITLVFADVDMGDDDADGFSLARWIAANFDNVEIVIASGVVLPVVGDLPDRATFIRKPFTAQMVLEHLAHTLPDGKQPEPLKHAV